MTSLRVLALVVAHNIPAVARNEAAGSLLRDLKHFVDRIDSKINRPKPDRFLGPCPTLIGRRQQCSTELRSSREAVEATCPTCKQTHQVDYLEGLLKNALRYHPMTAVEILGSRTSDTPGALEEMGYPVRRGLFYHWRKDGKLHPRAYRTASGATMPYRETDDDKPLYWIADCERLMGIIIEEQDTAS